MGDRDAQRLAIRQTGRHGGHERLGAQQHVAADEFPALVVAEGPRKEPGLAEHLEPVADTEHESAPARVGHHLIHNGRETRDGSTAEIVSVAEATGQDHQVNPLEVAVLVPEPLDVEPEFRAEGVFHVMVAIGPREGDDADFHAGEVRHPGSDSAGQSPSLLPARDFARPADEGDHRENRRIQHHGLTGKALYPMDLAARQVEDVEEKASSGCNTDQPSALRSRMGSVPVDREPTLLTTSTVTTSWCVSEQ